MKEVRLVAFMPNARISGSDCMPFEVHNETGNLIGTMFVRPGNIRISDMRIPRDQREDFFYETLTGAIEHYEKDPPKQTKAREGARRSGNPAELETADGGQSGVGNDDRVGSAPEDPKTLVRK